MQGSKGALYKDPRYIPRSHSKLKELVAYQQAWKKCHEHSNSLPVCISDVSVLHDNCIMSDDLQTTALISISVQTE